ncbi:MAG TPA: hypothetical protein VLM77_01535 [Methanobacterium sp.]|nr:hypothetical protein [Methanobacterium sp.]
MDFNNLEKLCASLIILFILFGFSNSVAAETGTDQVAWIQENDSSLKFTFLEANIHVTIKNNNDHVEYFKISQQYTGDGTVSPSIDWRVVSTNPPAVKMAKFINSGGDLGWAIAPGETKEVSFTLVETSPPPPFYIRREAMNNSFWPIINEPGLTATWFLPNEIEYLNPNLDLQLWQGRFCFFLKNMDTTGPRVEGIVRAPIVPIDSNLTASSPTVDFIDNENPSANTAAWDVTLYPGQTKHYSYTYQWPSGSSVTPISSRSSDQFNAESTAKTPVSVPTKNTGVPYGLFIVGGIVIASGIVYARFLR